MRRTANVNALLLLVAVAWAVLLAQRVQFDFSNVDDYLYSMQTHRFAYGLRHGPGALIAAWRQWQSSPLLPTMAAPVAAFTANPHALASAQILSLAALAMGVVSLVRLLGGNFVRSRVAGTAVCLLPPVLGYAVMVHFAVIASAALVWSVVCWLRSDRLRSRGWAAGFGLAAGLLSLSRVVAVVYVAALLAVCSCDLLLGARGANSRRTRAFNAAIAAGVAVVVAGPWWLTAGPGAIRYLLDAGYADSSGFTRGGGVGETAVHRLSHTADETGWLLGVTLLLAFVLVLCGAARKRATAELLVGAVALLTMVGLCSSSNEGTAFALPAVVLAAALVASAVPPGACANAALLVVAATTVGLLANGQAPAVGGHALWLSGYPGRGQAEEALGPNRGKVEQEALHRELIAAIPGSTLLVIRDDAIMNVNSLGYYAPQLSITTPGFGATRLTDEELRTATVALAGTSGGPYHQRLRRAVVEAQLGAAGFNRVFHRDLSPINRIEIWTRAPE